MILQKTPGYGSLLKDHANTYLEYLHKLIEKISNAAEYTVTCSIKNSSVEWEHGGGSTGWPHTELELRYSFNVFEHYYQATMLDVSLFSEQYSKNSCERTDNLSDEKEMIRGQHNETVEAESIKAKTCAEKVRIHTSNMWMKELKYKDEEGAPIKGVGSLYTLLNSLEKLANKGHHSPRLFNLASQPQPCEYLSKSYLEYRGPYPYDF